MRAISSTPFEQSPDYTLSSELARASLPQASRDEERKFAWAAAVCVLFLAVGIHGLFTRRVFTVPPPVGIEESIPVLFEPPPPPQPVENPLRPKDAEPDRNESVTPPPPPVVVAVANPAEAAFSVPVDAPVIIAPARVASAPPIDLRSADTSAPPITVFTGDTRGKYPPPTYPLEARERHVQGKVLLLVVVGRDGLVSRAEIRETSGFELLDQHAAQWVKSRWVWPPGEDRLFYVPMVFELK